MSSLTQLEALYLENTSIRWEMETEKVERSNAILDKLKHLSNLTTLEIHIPDAKMSKGLMFHKLERYKIFIGDHSKIWPMYGKAKYETSKALTLKLQTSEVGIIAQLKGIRSLHLNQIPSVSNLLHELGREGSLELRHLKVQNSPYTSCIIDSMRPIIDTNAKGVFISENRQVISESLFNEMVVLPIMETLNLSDIDVENFWHNQLPGMSSSHLEISDCPILEEMVVIEEGKRDIKLLFPQLHHLRIDHLVKLRKLYSGNYIGFPSLKEMEIVNCFQLREFIFDDKVLLPNLEILNLSNIDVEKIWHNQRPGMSSSLRRLYSGNYIKFPSLKELEIENCFNMRAFIFEDKVGFPSLEKMKISDMFNLKRIWHNQLAGTHFTN
ncbi:hypothetical protein EZV62_007158 [Acer yangbiense]|uniref:NB-ARC domain-containing protein n=1 Tax=Acer yangbiense TaxID=1000413 RepID=A0A5C7I8I9_9ROSI|nr:hypothetical protein EZV62_007158 [Acer yangbiense]